MGENGKSRTKEVGIAIYNKNPGQGKHQTVHGQLNSALPLVGCVTFCKLHNFSEPHFLHLHSGIISLLHRTGLLRGTNELRMVPGHKLKSIKVHVCGV